MLNQPYKQEIACAAGEQRLRETRLKAEALIDEARSVADAEARARLASAGGQLEQRADRELQDARLEARARIAQLRWDELNRVIEEAEREVNRLRTQSSPLYADALNRFVHDAMEQLGGTQFVVTGDPESISMLEQKLEVPGMDIQFVPSGSATGIEVATRDGNKAVDQSIGRRLQREEEVIHLAVSELLFGDGSNDSTGEGTPGELYWKNTLDFGGNLLYVRGVRGVGFAEKAEVLLADGSRRSGQTLASTEEQAVIQVFEGTKGIGREGTAVRFLGNVPDMVVDEDLLGRVFDGLGEPRDGLPPIIGRERRSLAGMPINPMAREYPREFIQTGVSSIDVLNSLVRGQKLPIFSGSGLPHNQLLAQVLRQARLLEEDAPFAIVFVAIGINHSEARFFDDVFHNEGVRERVSMFLNLADDPPMARLAAPRAGLTAAEYLAFEKDYHVLVIVTDMTNYADALREVSAARDEVPARKGYPGYLYSDLAEIYERAGRIRGRAGSITMMPVVTLHNDDVTHPVPDLTGYITEGQLMQSRELHARGINPPLDVLPSLSRLMKDGIGHGHTRDDHPGLASQLYAAYAEGRRARDLAAVVGEEDLSEIDRRYLRFADAFEARFIAQAPDEERSIVDSLDRGWSLLGLLPEDELTRVSEEQIRRHHTRGFEEE